jgi:uncharacterized protein (DUF427 family)
MHPRPDPVGPGQISVWTFPRPPRLEQVERHVIVNLGGETILEARRAYRVLETSHPPTWYFAREDFRAGALRAAVSGGSSFCEWKGRASYLDLIGGAGTRAGGQPVVAPRAAWTYPDPTGGFAPLRDHVALYAAAMDSCLVDGERVLPQPGGFYGGWITPEVTGPFKGIPGSMGW